MCSPRHTWCNSCTSLRGKPRHSQLPIHRDHITLIHIHAKALVPSDYSRSVAIPWGSRAHRDCKEFFLQEHYRGAEELLEYRIQWCRDSMRQKWRVWVHKPGHEERLLIVGHLLSLLSFANSSGIVPCNLFCWICKSWSLYNPPIVVGIWPVK